ncbi:MAG: electron transfer flavoprotein subunit alpha/FixB family protein [Deltaproteobacteria bacterium]|nr:electron transfer flavoprotein subunit alpha/FixB family protein [Deltaproteobacteria bacterium]MBW2118225.1 electron transfer flavoprotein subunit alpha/FixB family protein [Deltaproteobacteria bacterium]MBW2344408.1 electron transfer flavoprotein subunit alpha/FixB family protein [Deltaproteobacteria bacterium]
MAKRIIVIAEHFQSKIAPVTFELLACALELQRFGQGPINVVVLGDRIEDLAHEIAVTSGMEVTAIQNPNLKNYNGEIYKNILGELLPELSPACVCIAHTGQGWDFAPGLAIRLGAACVTGVERVFEEEGRICFTRPIFSGKLVADLRSASDPTIITVQPGSFKTASFETRTPGPVILRTTSYQPRQSRSLGAKSAKEESSGLTEADVIVSAGKGIGRKENLKIIERLAALFPKSAVAGSRSVCDSKWLDRNRQVGLTGATVTPKLYIGTGISGSTQHIAGMRSSGFIVAINTDPNAAIFNVSDVCVVEDLTTFVPVFIDEHEKSKA